MSRFVKMSVCAFAILAIAGVAQAATVNFGLVGNSIDGTWDLYAWTSGGDNDGVSGYSAKVEGHDGAAQVKNERCTAPTASLISTSLQPLMLIA